MHNPYSCFGDTFNVDPVSDGMRNDMNGPLFVVGHGCANGKGVKYAEKA